jgi:hypothetical protein
VIQGRNVYQIIVCTYISSCHNHSSRVKKKRAYFEERFSVSCVVCAVLNAF